MRLRRLIAVTLGVLFCMLAIAGTSFADDAEVLPKGVFRGILDFKFYLDTDERYNPDGDLEDVAVDYNLPLDSSVFPALGLFEQAVGAPPGSAILGSSIVSFKYEFTDVIATLAYGVNDRLTVGMVVPYYWLKNNVKSELDPSTATVGKNPALGTLAPLTVPGTVPLSSEEVRALLSEGVDTNGDGAIDIPGFGYKEFKTWSDNGIGDIEAGLKYQYYKSEAWNLAFTGGVRFPTGEVNDPDNLVDFEFGTGAWALLFRLQNDYLGVDRLRLNASVQYDLVLPDTQTLRVPDDVNLPITRNEEKVDRDYGDRLELELLAEYNITPAFSVTGLYEYWFKAKDDVDGDMGFVYESLEDETDTSSHVYILGLTYSTIPLYQEKKFSVPLKVHLAWRDRFAGSNNALDTSYIGVGFDIYF
jgi:hypothetical protein